MKTITLQIGNSDDKLGQAEWAAYYQSIRAAVHGEGTQVHFAGCSPAESPWQNACWVFVMLNGASPDALRERVAEIRARFRQHSVAWTEGETAFV
jgi:hypothetical protein